MSVWQLGIDFGTSYTVAAVATEGSVTVVDVESNGRSRMPSSVFMSADGEILVGTNAQHQAVFAPERYEPTPKRSLGEGDLFLGDDLVPVTDLVAAVLRRVYTEASRQQGETAPNAVFVTHPADWGETRLDVLREAIERADLSGYSLVAEPVAAAARIGLSATTPVNSLPCMTSVVAPLMPPSFCVHRKDLMWPDRRPAETPWAARTSISGSSTTSARCSLEMIQRSGPSWTTPPT